jgi:hypothetical protein
MNIIVNGREKTETYNFLDQTLLITFISSTYRRCAYIPFPLGMNGDSMVYDMVSVDEAQTGDPVPMMRHCTSRV